MQITRYRHLSHADIEAEKENCHRIFYSPWHIVSRMLASPLRLPNPFVSGSHENLFWRAYMLPADFLGRNSMHLPVCPKVSVIELPYGYPADTQEQANPVFREPNVLPAPPEQKARAAVAP